MGSDGLRLALVHDARRFDGTYGIFLNVREALRSSGVQVAEYTCYDPSIESEYSHDGTRIRGWRTPLGEYGERGFNRWSRVFVRQLRRVSADLVQVADVFLASLLAYRSDVIVDVADLGHLTTPYFPRSSSWLHNRMLKFVPRAPALVTGSQWARQDISQRLRYDAGRIFVRPPFPKIPPISRDALPTPEPATPARPWNLLYVAVDRPGKNLAFFLDVLASTDARFHGTLVTKPTAATLERVRRLGLGSRLTFRSDVENIATEYRAAQVLLFPSLYEGFGLPILEAMSQGLPVVTSNVTSVPEVVGDAGEVLPLGDPAPWVTAIDRLADLATYRAASRRSLERALSFTPERMRAGLLAAYECARPSRR